MILTWYHSSNNKLGIFIILSYILDYRRWYSVCYMYLDLKTCKVVRVIYFYVMYSKQLKHVYFSWFSFPMNLLYKKSDIMLYPFTYKLNSNQNTFMNIIQAYFLPFLKTICFHSVCWYSTHKGKDKRFAVGLNLQNNVWHIIYQFC